MACASQQRAAPASIFEIRRRDAAALRRFQTTSFRRRTVGLRLAIALSPPDAPRVRSGEPEIAIWNVPILTTIVAENRLWTNPAGRTSQVQVFETFLPKE
jgi:hypothetical protein